MMPAALCAQLLLPNFSSSTQKIVESAVKDGIVVLRQEYVLCDTVSGVNYSKDDSDYFGYKECIAINIDSSYIVTLTDIFEPWNFDSNYSKYKGQYKPVLSKVMVKNLDGQIYNDSDSLIRVDNVNDGAIAVVKVEAKPDIVGLSIDNENGLKTGWIVLLLKSDVKGDKNALKLQVINSEISFSEEKNIYNVKVTELSGQSILGGVFLSARTIALGQIQLYVAGLLKKVENNYVVYKLESIDNHSIVLENDMSEDETALKTELQPIGKKSKNKKKSKK